jgi:hypothetical protein
VIGKFTADVEWADLPHFENAFGLSFKQLREKIDKDETTGGFVNVKSIKSNHE